MTKWGRRGVAVSVDAPGSTEENVARLRELLTHKPGLAMISPRHREYVGRVSPDDVVVWAIGPSGVGNFQLWHQWTPVFRGRFVEVGGSKTRLEGRIAVNVFVPAFAILLAVLLGGWLSAGVPFLVGRLQDGGTVGAMTWLVNLILPLAFAGAASILLSYGGRLYGRDRIELEAFLREALARDP